MLLHGFGAGLGLWSTLFPTISELVNQYGVPAYAFDWLGMGRSSRIVHSIHAPKNDIRARVLEAEDVFLDSFERWRLRVFEGVVGDEEDDVETVDDGEYVHWKSRPRSQHNSKDGEGKGKLVLIGHSLGGYLSIAYALKYPQRVARVILLSPAGIHASPNALLSLSPSPPKSYIPYSHKGTDRRPNSTISTSASTGLLHRTQTYSSDTSSILSFNSDSSISVTSAESDPLSLTMSYTSPPLYPPTARTHTPHPPRKKLKRKHEPDYHHKHKLSSQPRLDIVKLLVEVLWTEAFNPFGLLRSTTVWSPWIVGKVCLFVQPISKHHLSFSYPSI